MWTRLSVMTNPMFDRFQSSNQITVTSPNDCVTCSAFCTTLERKISFCSGKEVTPRVLMDRHQHVLIPDLKVQLESRSTKCFWWQTLNWQWWDLNPRLLRDWSLNPAPWTARPHYLVWLDLYCPHQDNSCSYSLFYQMSVSSLHLTPGNVTLLPCCRRRCGLAGQSVCLVNRRSWVQIPAVPQLITFTKKV